MQRPEQRRTTHRIRIVTQEIGADPEEHLAPDSGGTRAELQRESTAQQPGSTGVPSPLGGVYVISVASRILNVHPQTLRKYERLGLVTPTRSIGMLRLYSAEDVLRVRLIRYMVNNLGMNLAGVEFALSLVNRIIDLRQRVEAMSSHEAPDRFVERELDEILRELGAVLPNSVPRV